MTEEKTPFKIDKTNLIKAGTIPVIAAAIGGALWLLGFLGGLMGILFWAVAAFAGYWYVNLVLKSGAKPSILEVAINGAILGAVVGLVYCGRHLDRHQHPLPRTGRRPGGDSATAGDSAPSSGPSWRARSAVRSARPPGTPTNRG
ncbi:MAG: hypothetical protein M0C28_12805 [Candidatus Moduliflexus flocculans]|nr:hypothetical protein [Candidatus Moduliflexus flocculans]